MSALVSPAQSPQLNAVLSNGLSTSFASSGVVGPKPCGYCSLASTGRLINLAASKSRRMFHTIRSWPSIKPTSFPCTSITSSPVSAADISSGLRGKVCESLMESEHTARACALLVPNRSCCEFRNRVKHASMSNEPQTVLPSPQQPPRARRRWVGISINRRLVLDGLYFARRVPLFPAERVIDLADVAVLRKHAARRI